MSTSREIRTVLKNTPTLEGAGVRLKRVFGFDQVPLFDPFLLLDDFRSDHPDDYLKGFPWHPHRGIETITYVLAGDVEHADSLGNKGMIGSGDVQWMTAGSGIIHQEMPKGDSNGNMYGFQLWANLPAGDKMMNPRYRDVSSESIPRVDLPNGTIIKIISGDVSGIRGPVRDIVIDPEFLDVTVPAHAAFSHPIRTGHTVFAYVIDGEGVFGEAGACDVGRQPDTAVADGTVALFGDGDEVQVHTGASAVRFLLVSGRPIGEPVAWQGPIVMNTREELREAFDAYERGTFIRHAG